MAPRLRYSFLVRGLLIALLAAITSVVLKTRVLERVDLVLYDILLPLQAPTISDEVVVIAVDDASLSKLGRWPWSRQLHARLLDRLAEFEARVVAFDILFSEAQRNDPRSDETLADAMKRYGRTVLAVAPTREQPAKQVSELLPLPVLAGSAAALGHVDMELDQDGICRSFYLYAGLDDARWPVLALAMMQAAGEPPRSDEFRRQQGNTGSTGRWMRSRKLLIPFAARGDAPRRLSVHELLESRIVAESVRGKYVLVGATATGLGDAISTPASPRHALTPGVELNAQILSAMLQDNFIRELPESRIMVISVLLIMAIMGMVVLVPRRFGIGVIAGGMVLVFLLSALLLSVWRLWFPPATSITMLALALPLWGIWSIGVETRLRRSLAGHIDHLAKHHPVTRLPNQAALDARLEELAEPGGRQADCVGLALLNIDWPRSASDISGTSVDKTMIQTVADQLRVLAYPGDFVAHISGDDFAVLTTGHVDRDAVEKAVTGIVDSLRRLAGNDADGLQVVSRCGVSVWPADAAVPHELIRNAYAALLKSRLDSKQSVCMYSADIGEEIQTRSRLEKALLHALERNEFEVHYQPLVAVENERVVGVEALLRWQSPQLGEVAPAEFIPVAEHVGMIGPIGEWVMDTACRQVKAWNDAGLGPLRLAVNLSPLQFSDPGLVNRIRGVIDRVGFAPDELDLEITESTIMRDIDGALKAMRALKAEGVALAIDDFGTGYSSLASLRQFPLDMIKIDHSFIHDIENSEKAEDIARAIIDMGKRLGLKVIAEGVETSGQDEFCRRHSCDELQGFMYSYPLRPIELEDVLRDGKIPVRKSA